VDYLMRYLILLSSAVGMTCLVGATTRGDEKPALRAEWNMPPRCTPFDSLRIKDLTEELHETGYRLVIAIHPEQQSGSDGEYPFRDLYVINADGTGLTRLTNTPEKDERVPRTSPDGTMFTYNYGDYLMDVATPRTREHWGGYVWTPDSKQTVYCEKNRLVYTDIKTGKTSKPVRVARTVSIVDMSFDREWLVFEIRNYLGCAYSIDFMATSGGAIRKLPNHPAGGGECHPAFSPDGKWMCWNSGGSLSIRRFDPALPDGMDGRIITLPKESLGQDPCGRWSHCGRYIAFVKIPHQGSWKVHSPICIVRLADNKMITISPPGWLAHHWDYDWLPPAPEH
jgi:Tol biopolymer transport system component